MCHSMTVYWHHLANTTELVLPLAHPRVHNPNGKSIDSAVFAQLMAESPYTLQWAPLSPKITLTHEEICALCIDLPTQGLKWQLVKPRDSLVRRFEGNHRTCYLEWLKYTSLIMGDLDTHLTHDSLGPSEPNGISIGSAVFAQMTTECPYTLQWDDPFPPESCQFPWGILTPI